MNRLTTSNPKNNMETLMNYCSAKNNEATLIYANGKENINLCEYISNQCVMKGCELTADEVLEDGLMDCGHCPVAITYYLGCQAAENNARLKYYEDLEENGLLTKLPCKIGEELFVISSRVDGKAHIRRAKTNPMNIYYYAMRASENKAWVTRAEAEKVLKEINKINDE